MIRSGASFGFGAEEVLLGKGISWAAMSCRAYLDQKGLVEGGPHQSGPFCQASVLGVPRVRIGWCVIHS